MKRKPEKSGFFLKKLFRANFLWIPTKKACQLKEKTEKKCCKEVVLMEGRSLML
jgi:hypothetical protein